ncbi:NAD(P)H-dependent oxidoreductase [Limosilactobacillus caecicola]|uniref:NAD(P)H-dependent oxidoreductase n=1 Tax=Limosilactobacillus caecicola TaxID=2941332 RepID=UPI00203D6ABF|nr:NAD(P)H-dependent oxidoreductase [Limosilactobacillus caecicola]
MNEQILIIYCHPYDHSFNHAVLTTVEHNLQEHQQSFRTIDLYTDNFDPRYSTHELSLYQAGQTVDPLVKDYLTSIQRASAIIFITPVWWNSIPGMLKGFIDKVMKEGPGLSHTVTRTGIHGELSNIKHCYVLTTSTSPTWYLRLWMGNAVQKIFVNKTLRQLGFRDRHWQNFGGITHSTAQRRQRYLNRLVHQQFKS